ncbi:unnamed protein product [Caenorhabditis brenneri]
MEQIKKSHAQEIHRMKERYAELEKENQEYGKVFEGFKAMQGKRKESLGRSRKMTFWTGSSSHHIQIELLSKFNTSLEQSWISS